MLNSSRIKNVYFQGNDVDISLSVETAQRCALLPKCVFPDTQEREDIIPLIQTAPSYHAELLIVVSHMFWTVLSWNSGRIQV